MVGKPKGGDDTSKDAKCLEEGKKRKKEKNSLVNIVEELGDTEYDVPLS